MANSTFSEIPTNFSQPAVTNPSLNWVDIARESKFKDVQPSAIAAVDAPIPSPVAQGFELPPNAHDFTMTNATYETARMLGNVGAMYANYMVRTGLRNGAPVLPMFATVLGDDYVDRHFFKNVQRGAISTYADIAATGIAFLPQEPVTQAAEMVSVHTAGMLAEDYEGDAAKVIDKYV